MSIDNFSVPPYFDDFSEIKKYLKILFRPRYAVQTRELNQIQTLLQNQIGRFGNHIFKDGAMVVPGNISYDLDYRFVKVVSTTNLDSESYRIANVLGKVLTNVGGIKATVVNHLGTDVDGNVTFFVKYTKSSTAGTVFTFSNGEVLTVEGTGITMTTKASAATGTGCAANVDSGIYYAKGYFILVDKQTVILDAYTNTPSYRIGLQFIDSIVTPEDDGSLNDNAQGTPNYTAPGAHRYKAELILTKLGLDTVGDPESENFYELLKLSSGNLDRIVERTEYSELEKTFARRTFDESGNYITKPFYIKANEHASDATKLTVDIGTGKAYVRGYEIAKVGKTQIDIDKARAFERANNASISTPIGNYIRVNNLSGVPDIKTYTKVSLYDKRKTGDQVNPSGGTVIGTARIRDIQLESGTYGTDAAVYKLYLFDISITSTTKSFSNVKALADLSNKFTADIVLDIFYPVELGRDQKITLTNASVNVTGKNTLWQTDPSLELKLAVNDVIAIEGVFYNVATVVSNTSITLGVVFPGVTGDYGFGYTYAKLYEGDKNNLIFPLPFKYPRKIKSTDDITVDTNYVVRREYVGLTVSGGGVSISTGDADEEFIAFSQQNYIVTYDTAITQPGGVGAVVNVSSGNFSSLPNASLTINGLTNGETVRVITTIKKKQGAPSTQKTKTLASTTTTSPVDERNLNVLTLGKADVYRITGIYMQSGSFSGSPNSGDTNITDRYDLDTGQRDNFYDLGRITLKPGARIPDGRIIVYFDYFTHTSGGTYFSVDSYVGTVDYEDIPEYSSKESGWVYPLRDCLDFRPRINDAASAFDNTTGSLTEFPVQSSVSADFSYYLNRIDKLYLDYRGNFNIISGVPGINPKPPENPTEDGMVTHILSVRAYTLDPSAVDIEYIENKRFTMNDIEKLEKRVKNLEYYTTLSLKEKEIQDLEIIDATTGLNRFKNGFIVDPFNGHGIGDVQNPDYQCAIDMNNGFLRPIFKSDNVNLELLAGSSSNYQVTGDLITLPYTNVVLASQKLASNFINVNPFNVINFIGKIDLNPPSDEWKDTERQPDLIVNHEGNFDSISQMANGMGTIWNEWQENWSGVTSSNTQVLSQLTFRSATPQLHRNLDGTVDRQSGLAGVRSRPGIDQWPVRQVTVTRTTSTVDSRQTRTGLRANVTPRTIQENLGDKVVNVAYIPFIRTRDVIFNGYGLKPNTRVYPFFDGIAVSTHCSPGATYVTPNGALITDATGKVTGTFRIPNSNVLAFRTGSRVFRLTSSNTNDLNSETSGNATYVAEGLLETKQSTILSTRNADVAWDQVIDNRVVTDTNVDVNVTDTDWIDPLAQTFLVQKDGGTFLTKLKLYFQSKDANIPVTVQIRETVNGYPGQRIVPFGEVVLDSANVHTNAIVNGSLVIDGGAPDASFGPEDFVATEFVFTNGLPYLKQGSEYCFVVLANSDAYNLWIGTFGINPETQIPYTIVGSEIPIQSQPYGGSFFKSQNASTWTAVQEADIMFEISCASFNTAVTGDVVFNNRNIPVKALTTNPIQTINGSSVIRIKHPNHGMPANGLVTLAGVTDTNGILAARINGNRTVQNPDLDSYSITLADVDLTSISSSGTALTGGTNFLSTLVPGSGILKSNGEVRKIITVTNNSTAVLDAGFTIALSSETVKVTAGSTGTSGGAAVTATEDKQVDTLYPTVARMEFPNTSSDFFIKTTSGKSINGTQTPYVFDSAYTAVIVNENIDFNSPRLIASSINESASNMNMKSFALRSIFNSTNANVSPVIDTQRLSLITVANRIDSPTYLTKNVEVLDTENLVSANTTIAFSGTTISSANGTASRLLSVIEKGKYITITGAVAGSGANNKTYRIIDVVYVANTSIAITVDQALTTEVAGPTITVKYLNRFISELAPLYGSVASKYITRRIQLENPANALRIQVAANIPQNASIEMYYKPSYVDDNTLFDSVPYVLVEPDSAPGNSSNLTEFIDITYTINDLPDFIAASFKIVMKSTSTTSIPILTDFSAIALGT